MRSDVSGTAMSGTRAAQPSSSVAPEQEMLVRLAYELLDAHEDTRRLTQEPTTDLAWRGHLVYLRDLQRVGRELLAQHRPAP